MHKCVIFVHPMISVKMIFALVKSYGYKILSIVTELETTRIDVPYEINHFGWPLIAKPSENTVSMSGFSISNNNKELYFRLSNNAIEI